MSGSDPLRLVLVGWGAIARRVGALLAERGAPVVLAGVAVRDGAAAREGLPAGTPVITDAAALAGLRPGLVVECAGRGSVLPWGRAALDCGADLAICSTSALTEDAILPDLLARAQAVGRQVVIPPGALAGVDALAAAGRLGLDTVRHEIVKPARAWVGTPAEALCDLAALTGAHTFFEGTAREAAARFPQNANVAVIAALAGLGLDRTQVALTADPGASLNRHRLTATGDFGRLDCTVENRPLATNPKSSELVALAVVRMIEGRAGALVL